MVLKKRLRVVIIAMSVVAVFVALPHSIISYMAYPFIKLQSIIIDPIKRNYLQQQTYIEKIRADYDQLMQRYLQLQSTTDYVAEIDEIVAFNKRYSQKDRLVTQVLERYFGADEHYILLDKGSHDGIQEDMIVVHQDMLVGRITTVYPWYSRCMLITDRRCKVACYCADTKAYGIMQGTNVLDQLQLLHVSHLNDIALGDIVISSGQGTIFARGFGLGTIISSQKHHMTYDIICKPLVDFATLKHCSIVCKDG